MSIERGPSPEEMGIRQQVEKTEQGREVRNRPRTEVEAEIRNELEEIAKQEIPLQKKLQELMPHVQKLDAQAKQDLQNKILNLQTELTRLENKIFGRNPKRQEELKDQIAALQHKLYEPVHGDSEYHQQKKLIEVALSPLKEKKESLIRLPGVRAYGGTGYIERRRTGEWPKIPDSTLQDLYGLKSDELRDLTFGVGELEKRRFLILRQRQNVGARGGYPYSVFIDPGEVIWRMYRWNGALMIKNILKDEFLRERFLKSPERVASAKECEQIESLDQGVLPLADEKIRQLAKGTSKIQEPLVTGPQFMEKPTPDTMAQALAALPEDERKNMTFLIGGSGVHGKYFGSRVVWDSGR